jgi:hypothetical protein
MYAPPGSFGTIGAERMTTTVGWDPALPERAKAAWLAAPVAQKEAALVHATQFIDTIPFKGQRLTDGQEMSWPRKGIFRDDGVPVAGIPPEIKDATGLVAGFILAKVPFDVPAVAHVFAIIGHLVEEGHDLSDGKITWH